MIGPERASPGHHTRLSGWGSIGGWRDRIDGSFLFRTRPMVPARTTAGAPAGPCLLTSWAEACDLGNIRLGKCVPGATAAGHCFCISLFWLLQSSESLCCRECAPQIFLA